MSRKEREARGKRLAETAGSTAGDSGSHGRNRSGLVSASNEVADQARRAACTALSLLFLRDDGWLRAVPDGEGKSLYLKWKFSRGKWAGSYVMAVVEVWDWDNGVQLLRDKVEEVDLGVRTPTRDSLYNPE